MTQLVEFAKNLEKAQRKRRHDARSANWAPTMTPATSLGYNCERRTVYQRTQPEQAAPITEELASIFEEGGVHERDVRAELSALGYEVVETEVTFRDPVLEITGRIDGKIQIVEDRDKRPRRIPIEIKSYMGTPPKTEDEWRNSDSGFLRRWYAQLQTYLYLTSEPEGLGLFKSKSTGLWAVVAVTLDYGYTERLLKRAERIREAVKSGKLPQRIPDRSECAGCPFKDTVCHPEEHGIDPTYLIDDMRLLQDIRRREELDPARQEFAKIDKGLKERFKLTQGDQFVVGGPAGYLVTKKVSPKSTRITFTNLKETEQ